MTITEHLEWRYVPYGRVRHALTSRTSPRAFCGVGVFQHYDWRGTGNQDEYERVAMLPECRHCVRMVRG